MTIYNIGPIAELRSWRNALIDCTWVQWTPKAPGEICAVERYVSPASRLGQVGVTARRALNEAFLRISLPLPMATCSSITRWNDADGRVLEDVVGLFDLAIQILEDEQDARV